MTEKNYKGTLHACYLGYITQAIVVNLAPLLFIIFQTDYDLSFQMIGTLVSVNFVTQLLVDIIAARFVDKVGYRKFAVAGHAAAVAGLVLLGILPGLLPFPFAGLLISVMVFAIGGGIIEVLINPIVDSLPGETKVGAISLLHSFYSWGQVLVVAGTTLFLLAFGNGAWMWLPILWAALPLFNLFNFLRVPLMPTIEEHERVPLKELFSTKLFVVIVLMMLCAAAVEQTVAQWSSLFAEKGLGISKTMGDLLGPCLFAAFMGLSRMLFGKHGKKLGLENTLLWSSALCVVFYIIIVFVRVPMISLLGCAGCGFAVANLWPGLVSLHAHNHPAGGAAAFGILAVFGDLGCALGPFIAGAASDAVVSSSFFQSLSVEAGMPIDELGLKLGILTSIIFAILLVAGMIHIKRSPAIDQSETLADAYTQEADNIEL